MRLTPSAPCTRYSARKRSQALWSTCSLDAGSFSSQCGETSRARGAARPSTATQLMSVSASSKPRMSRSALLMWSAAALSPSHRRQKALLLEDAEPFLEHVLGVHDLMEAGAAELDGRDMRRRPRLGAAEAHGVVGILQREPDEAPEIR